MKITVIGASAGIGLNTVSQALERGHEVTAFSRNMISIPDHDLLTKVNGDATSEAAVRKAILDADAVIVTIGTKNKKDTSLFVETAKALVKASSDLHFKKPIFVVTGFGAGESARYLGLLMKTVIHIFLKNQYQQKTEMEKLITESSLAWEIVRPGMLTNGPLTKSYQTITHLSPDVKIGKISRADVADFLINQAENPSMLYKFPALTR